MIYQLISNSDVIKMIDDAGIVSFIPNDPGNRDRARYEQWLLEDNEPLPADEE